MLKEMLEILFLCMIFIGILVMTYWVTKKIGMMNKQMSFNKNMQVIEVLPLMQGQYLYIVKVGQRYYLMACAQKGNISYLKELDAAELNFEEIKGKSFQEYLTYLMKGKQGAKDEK